MTFPEIKLVDAPTATATVLFDFNDTGATPRREVHADDFTIGTPELVGDVDAVDPLYGQRLVSFTCAMTGTKPAVAAAQSALARLMLASGQGWLWVRMTPTSRLLFFRTYRAQPGDLSFDLIQSVLTDRPERWELKIDLPCEPFAYGERVVLASQTVYGDPTTGSTPCSVVLPTVTGDVTTPLRFDVQVSSAPSYAHRMFINVHSGAVQRVPLSLPIGTSDGWSGSGSDTDTGAAESGYTNGSRRTTTFATNTSLSERMGQTVTLAPGRYRALVRAVITNTGPIQFRFGDAGQIVVASSSPAAQAQWVDLGEVNLPGRQPKSISDTWSNVPTRLALHAGQPTGSTSQVKWDHLLMVPVTLPSSTKSQTALVDFTSKLLTTETAAVDGVAEDVWKTNTSTGALTDSLSPQMCGVFPAAVPGQINVVTVLTVINPTNNDLITRNVTLTPSYYPLFLYVGDS